MRPLRIGIFGHYGKENLGDEAIILACVKQLRECLPDTELVLFSSNPMDSAQRYSLPAYPIRILSHQELAPSEQRMKERRYRIDHTGMRAADGADKRAQLKSRLKQIPIVWPFLKWIKGLPERLLMVATEIGFLWEARRQVRKLDLVLVAGSNQFLDNFGGPWGFPYTLLKWTWLARSAGVPVAFASVGAGPLDARLSHGMIRLALRGRAYLSFRDAASRTLVDPEDRLHAGVCPDLAFGIRALPGEPPVTEHTDVVVAVNPMAVYDARYWYIKDAEKYGRYVRMMAQVTERLHAAGYNPCLFATQPKDENVIEDVIQELRRVGCTIGESHALFQPLRSVDALLTFLKRADVVVATRFHGTVLALQAGKPTIGVCYYRKAADLLREFGQHTFAFDVDSVTSRQLCAAVDEAVAQRYLIGRQIAAKRDEYYGMVTAQFKVVSDMACAASARASH